MTQQRSLTRQTRAREQEGPATGEALTGRLAEVVARALQPYMGSIAALATQMQQQRNRTPQVLTLRQLRRLDNVRLHPHRAPDPPPKPFSVASLDFISHYDGLVQRCAPVTI